MCVGKLLEGPEQSALELNDTEPGLRNHVPGLILGSAVSQLCNLKQDSFSLCGSSFIC